jgi:hypothetical protein
MDIGRIVGGAVVLVIAIWTFMTMTDVTAKYAGGAILAIIALALLITGFKKK